MVNRGHALSRDELIRTLTAYTGITPQDGAGDGTTLIDSALKDNPHISPSGIPEKTVLIMSGDARGEDKGSSSFNNGTGAITLQGTGFSAQIKAGTIYRILNISSVEMDVARIEAKVDPKVMGRAQIAATTIDLDQAAATYDLFTGTTQAVVLESLNIKMPTGAAGGAITSISIQTDDATPGVIISAVDGAVANLTSEADLGWVGTLYITVGTKIQLTIAGGAHGAAYVCNVTAKCRAVVAGGYLA